MLKKVISVILSLILLLNFTTLSYANDLSLGSEAAILIDAKTGEILYEKNSHEENYPASTTKIMTAILTLEMGNLDDKVVVDDRTPYEIEGSHIALEPGEVITLEDLLYALLIESANDAAVVIAKHLGGTVENFAKMMNTRAEELGAKNTNFTNPNGLPDPEHTTSAYDLAMIAKHAMTINHFAEIVSHYTYTIGPTNKKDEPRYLKSANKLLYSSTKINVDGEVVPIQYPGADGIKTGYTVAAQQCLVSTAVRGNRRLIAVVLRGGSNDRWIDTHKLLDYGFDNYTSKQITFKKEFIDNIEVERGDQPYITAIVGQDLFVSLPKGRGQDIKKEVILPDKIQAPITKDQVLGKIEYKLDDRDLGVVNIVATSQVNLKPIYEAVDTESQSFVLKKWWVWLIVVAFLWRIYISIRRRKKRRRRRRSLSFSKKL